LSDKSSNNKSFALSQSSGHFSSSGVDRREQNLINIRERIGNLSGRINEAIWICSAGWKNLEYASPGFESLWGIKAAELKKDPLIWVKSLEPSDRKRVRKLIREFDPEETSEQYVQNCKLLKSDREERLLSIYFFSIEGSGDGSGIAVVSRDVTELEQVSRANRESDKKYRELFNQLNDIVYIHDLEGRIIEVNDAAVEKMEYGKQEFKNMTIVDLVVPELRKTVKKRFVEMEKASRLVVESKHLTKNGSILDVEINARLIDYHGQPAVLALVRDIAGRKQAETQIKKQNEMLQAVIDNIPVMITWYDDQLSKFRVNHEFTRSLGWTNEDTIRKNLMEACYPDPVYRQQVEKYMREASMKWMDFELTARDGASYRSSWTNVALSDGTQIGIGIDMEERLAQERAIETLVESTTGITGQHLFDKVTANICDWLEMDGSVIGLFEGNKVKAVSMVIDGAMHRNVTLEPDDLSCREVIEKGIVHLERDVHKLYRKQNKLRRTKEQGYVGILLSDKNGEPAGVLAAISRKELPLPPRTEKVLRVLAARVSAELDRIKADEALAQQSLANRALAELARQLIKVEDVAGICRLVLDYAMMLTHSDQGFAAYVEPRSGKLICPRIIRTGTRRGRKSSRKRNLGKIGGMWGWVVENRQALMINDTGADHRYEGKNGADPVGGRRFFGVPALIGPEFRGLLTVADAEWDYTERDGYILERIAALFAIAIQRHQDQNELRKLSEAVAQSPNSIVITDPKGYIEFVNPRFCEVTGYSSDEVVGKKPSLLKTGQTGKAVYEQLWRTISSGKIWKGELLNRKKDGGTLWELVSVAPLLDSSGRITHYIQVKEDISQIKDAEQALKQARDELEQRVLERTESLEKANENLRGEIERRRKSEQALSQEQLKLESMLKHERLVAEVARGFNSASPFNTNLRNTLEKLGEALELDGVVVWQIDVSVSKASHVMTWNIGKKSDCEFSADFDRKDLPEFFDRIRSGETVVTDPSNNKIGLSGYFKYCGECCSLSCPLSSGGRIKGLIDFRKRNTSGWSEEDVSVFTALSEIITNAWERDNEIQARLEAERRHTESVQMVERATRLASIGVVAAGITHEINQPLNAIRLTADGSLLWLERNQANLPEKFVERLKKISSHVERITRIIRHMREFWVVREVVDAESFDLRDAVTEAVGLMEQQLSSHGIQLEQTHTDEPVQLSGDRLHMEQIVINLMVNAMQALDSVERDNPKIKLITRADSEQAVLEIEDNGPGFNMEDRDRMFEMFFTTKKPGVSSGLGLAIVKRYTEELGGEVVAENLQDGFGALFRVTLPLEPERKRG
jgi:PAS domain S-box-containing protein